MIHAYLDGNNVCDGYGNLTNIETAPNLVYLPDGWDEDLKWRKWVNGAWSADKFPPAPPVPGPDVPGEIDKLKAENTALNQQLAQFNNDFVAFTDFYFVKNPTQA